MAWNSLVRTAGSLAKALSAPPLRRAALAGTGRALPARVLANADFPPSLETSDEWIRTRTGIRERRIAGPNETSFTLGLEAARQALNSSGLSPRDLDLIIFATVTPETVVPSNACRVQGALGCRPIGAFDVNGACTGFVQGLTVASQFLAAGTCEHVLVIGADLLSRVLDYRDRTSCILFGDGAGAVVLSASDEGDRGILWSKICSDGAKCDMIRMASQVTHQPAPTIEAFEPGPAHVNEFIQLNGREVFKFAVRTMVSLVQEALEAVKLPRPDRLFLVPHQVNQRIIDAALEDLPISADRVVLNLERYGNTSAASIPIALDEALRAGTVGPGDHLLLVAFGGGMTWGGAVISL
jgi:3-oxoacyl-[acyl-carrier-protein] synthase-3